MQLHSSSHPPPLFNGKVSFINSGQSKCSLFNAWVLPRMFLHFPPWGMWHNIFHLVCTWCHDSKATWFCSSFLIVSWQAAPSSGFMSSSSSSWTYNLPSALTSLYAESAHLWAWFMHAQDVNDWKHYWHFNLKVHIFTVVSFKEKHLLPFLFKQTTGLACVERVKI